VKKRLLTALLVATGVFGAVVGLAASLDVTTDQLGSGTEVVSSCDTIVNTAYTYDQDGGISAVTVEDIVDGSLVQGSGPCDGETVFVELLDGTAAVIGTGDAVSAGDALDIADDDVLVTLDAAAPAEDVAEVRVTITG
jgi:hypothetical protein